MKIALAVGKGRVVAGVAVSMVLSTSAFAQCTVTPIGVPGPLTDQLAVAAAAGGAASGAFAGALGNLATAFLSQQGSAFVSAPGNPKPDQEGGGVWARAVGGEVTNKFSSSATGSIVAPGLPFLNTAVAANCLGSVHQSFGGMQVGQDISRLNVRGWNFHLGTMAGYLASNASDNAGGKSNFDVPFFGAYAVATYGRFFADVSVRREFYSATLNNPTVGLFDQRVGAGGVSISTSAGYNFALDNNWFIEPSGGFIWSRTNVDSFNVSGGAGANGIVSTYNTDPIDSKIGRLGVRVGTTISSGNMIWQPFASANVFHEFAGNVTSTASSLQNGAFVFFGPCPFCVVSPATLTGTNSTTRVGTYGQYSLGLAAQVANTGWLGFVRADYRHGDYIDGWTANAGIRYQFTPETIAAVMPTKAPVKAVAYIPATNWTGFYVGGFLGGVYGNTDIRFVGDPNNAGNNPRTAGALGGFQLGYNYQMANQWVLGIEGDVGAANMHGARTCGADSGKDAFGNVVRFTPAFLNCEATANWMATLAGRLGVSFGRTLYFVKGGGAITDDNVNVKCIFGPLNNTAPFGVPLGPCLNPAAVVTNGFGTSGTRTGWLVGFGTEFDLGKNWSAKAEYDFIDFGSRTATATDGTTVLRDSGTLSQVKIGLNYRFSGPTAVVAKY
jgi:opacity protein-like surface antigen